jgi:hypothetical protein
LLSNVYAMFVHKYFILDFGFGSSPISESKQPINTLRYFSWWSYTLYVWFNRVQDDSTSDDADAAMKSSSSRDSAGDVADTNNSRYFQLKSGHKVASTIDLHYFTEYISVVALYDIFLQLYDHREELEIASHRGLTIIPGRGNHVNPDGRRGVLRQAIENFLTSEVEPKGILEYKITPCNDGRIFVTGESLIKWAIAKSLIDN